MVKLGGGEGRGGGGLGVLAPGESGQICIIVCNECSSHCALHGGVSWVTVRLCITAHTMIAHCPFCGLRSHE